MQNRERSKRLAALSMLSALAFIVMFFFRIPFVPAAPFLKYDAKDVIIVIGGFLYGPAAALAMSAAVSFVEMFTASTTGPIGLTMNILSTSGFACAAAAVYKKKRTLAGAVTGLAAGVAIMSIVMLVWNYIVTPIYMGVSRDFVAEMLIPVFLPFNLLKGGINAAVTVVVYKPVKLALLKSGLFPSRQDESAQASGKINFGVVLAAVFVLTSCILLILTMQGKL